MGEVINNRKDDRGAELGKFIEEDLIEMNLKEV